MRIPALFVLLAAGASSNGQTGTPQGDAREEIVVRCRDRAGKPVADAEVHVFQQDTKGRDGRYRQYGPYRSGADGVVRTRVPTLPASRGARYRRVYARVPDELVGVSLQLRLGKETVLPARGPIDVVLCPSREFAGLVHVPEGFDRRRVEVRVVSLSVSDGREFRNVGRVSELPRRQPGLDDALPAVFVTRPDAAGRFVLADLPATGLWALAATAPGLGLAQWKRGSEDSLEDAELRLEPAGRFHGKVLDPSGKAVAGARLECRPVSQTLDWVFRATTDTAGRYDLTGLPPCDYEVFLRTDEHEWVFRARIYKLAAGQVREIDLKLDRGCRVSGIVVDSVDDRPLAGARVRAVTPAGPGNRLAPATTDAEGRFVLWLPKGRVGLIVQPPRDYRRPRRMRQLVVRKEPIANIKIALQRRRR